MNFKLSHLFAANAILYISLGIAFAMFTPIILNLYGIPEAKSNDVQLYWALASFARLFGAMIFGLGFVLWSLRYPERVDELETRTRFGLIYSLIIANVMGVFVAVTQQASVWLAPAGWITVGIFAVFGVAYIYFLVIEVRLARAPAPTKKELKAARKAPKND
jgi:hypothetical protein